MLEHYFSTTYTHTYKTGKLLLCNFLILLFYSRTLKFWMIMIVAKFINDIRIILILKVFKQMYKIVCRPKYYMLQQFYLSSFVWYRSGNKLLIGNFYIFILSKLVLLYFLSPCGVFFVFIFILLLYWCVIHYSSLILHC